MRLLRPALLLAVLLVFAAPTAAVWADDGETPGAKKPPAEKPAKSVRWIYDKGGDTRALDVTHMSPEIRNSLHVQMTANDWVRRSPPDAAAPTKTPAPKPKTSEPKSDTEKDIAELIKRGGKLPDDWRPAGMGPSPLARGGGRPSVGPGGPSSGPPRLNMPPPPRALARLVLAFLEVKKDPVKAAIYEAVLRAAAAAYSEPLFLDAATAAVGLDELMRAGLADPKSAGVYREIQKLFGEDVEPRRPRHRPPPAAPPFEGPYAGVPAQLGGAPVRYTIVGGSRARFLRVGKVPADSTAHAAGLREGDRIVRIDGKHLDGAAMRRAAKVFTDGGQLTLELVRKDDKRETLSLLLEKE